MALPGVVQALIAAFAFGFVVNAASASLFLYVKGQGSAIFRDGLRLVLITFLASAAVWAQVDFVTTLVSIGATSGCQVALIFGTVFDQLARVFMEQYLVWAVGSGGAVSATEHLFSQILVAIRFVLGLAFVGFSKPTFNPICVAQSSLLPIAITVITLDAVILGALVIRAFSSGLVQDVTESRPGFRRSKAILLTIGGLAVWMGASVPMLLGLDSIDFVYRTAVPAAGLIVLVVVVALFSDALVSSRERASRAPDSPRSNALDATRSISTSDSTDYPPSRYEDLKAGSAGATSVRSVDVEPPMPGMMPQQQQQQQQQQQRQQQQQQQQQGPTTGFESMSRGPNDVVVMRAEVSMPSMPMPMMGAGMGMVVAPPGSIAAPAPLPKSQPLLPTGPLPTIARPVTGIAGIGGLPVQGQLFPPMRPSGAVGGMEGIAEEPSPSPSAATVVVGGEVKTVIRQGPRFPAAGGAKKTLFDLARGGPGGGRLKISAPILQEGGAGGVTNPLSKIATIDLATAVAQDRERRELALQRASTLIASRPAPQPPNAGAGMGMGMMGMAGGSVKRKEVATATATAEREQPEPEVQMMMLAAPSQAAMTTSAQLSPGRDEVRRRSPRQPPDEFGAQAQAQAQAQSQPTRPARPERPEAVAEVMEVPAEQPTEVAKKAAEPQKPKKTGKSKKAAAAAAAAEKEAATLQPATTPRQLESMLDSPSPTQADFPKPPQMQMMAPKAKEVLMEKGRERKAERVRERAAAAAASVAKTTTVPPLPQPPAPAGNSRPTAEPPRAPPTAQLPRRPDIGQLPLRRDVEPVKEEPKPAPEPAKTALQRRPTTGLPSNPRAQGMTMTKQQQQEAKSALARQQTVMFVNNIVYDNPGEVEGIIKGASDRLSKQQEQLQLQQQQQDQQQGQQQQNQQQQQPGSPPTNDASVVNRPRPIPRGKGDAKERGIFPAEPSPRTPSRPNSLAPSRKSILQSNPGSPTRLPELPPLPMDMPMPPQMTMPGGQQQGQGQGQGQAKMGQNPDRPLPNDTKSMTFDEKMTLLFPAPPSGSSSKGSGKRFVRMGDGSGEVPELPALPLEYTLPAMMPASPRFWDDDSTTADARDRTNRTTKTSASGQTSVLGGVEELIGSDGRRREQRRPNNYTVVGNNNNNGSNKDSNDDVGRSWLPGIDDDDTASRESAMDPDMEGGGGGGYDGAKRKSSPIIPSRGDDGQDTGTTTGGRQQQDFADDDDTAATTTNWGGSVQHYSPVVAVAMQQSRINAKSTYIQKGLLEAARPPPPPPPPRIPLPVPGARKKKNGGPAQQQQQQQQVQRQRDDARSVSPTESGDSRPVMTVMLDSGRGAPQLPPFPVPPTNNTKKTSSPQRRQPERRGTWFAVDDDAGNSPSSSSSGEEGGTGAAQQQQRGSQWHRRVGDDCPSFSGRRERLRARKMPPPTPLLLGRTTTKTATGAGGVKMTTRAPVVAPQEPSPLESPDRALQAIQAQLRRYEQQQPQPADGSRDSVGSQGQRGRLALLENLEKEMGLQETRWMDMQHDLARDSMSSMQTATTPGGGPASRRGSEAAVVVAAQAQPAPQKQQPQQQQQQQQPAASVMADRRASRRALIRRDSVGKATSGPATPSSVSSDATRASAWQARVAEAQSEYADKGAEFAARRNNNTNNNNAGTGFLGVVAAAKGPAIGGAVAMALALGSPTPPESDVSGGEDSEAEVAKAVAVTRNVPPAARGRPPFPEARRANVPPPRPLPPPRQLPAPPPRQMPIPPPRQMPVQMMRREKTLWRPASSDAKMMPVKTHNKLWTPAVRPPKEVRVEVVARRGADRAHRPRRHVTRRAETADEPPTVESDRLWDRRTAANARGGAVRRGVGAGGLWKPSAPPVAAMAPYSPQQQQDMYMDMDVDMELDDDELELRFQEEQAAPRISRGPIVRAREMQQQQQTQQQQQQQQQRPTTQRPPRRSRRVTLLPDIVESPEPLPDKRGTLGIFQFPWGERSDTANAIPSLAPGSRPTMFMAMPGTMTSGGPAVNAALEARARQVASQEYSSSFFDDYDEDDDEDGSDEDGSGGDDDDDVFDETTLWEIASLLKTDNIPSKNSLLPLPRANGRSTAVLIESPGEDDGFALPSDDDDEEDGRPQQGQGQGKKRPSELTLGRPQQGQGQGKKRPSELTLGRRAAARNDVIWENKTPVAELFEMNMVEPITPMDAAAGRTPSSAAATAASRRQQRPEAIWGMEESNANTAMTSLDINAQLPLVVHYVPEPSASLLWVPAAQDWTPAVRGLFKPNSGRTVFRTTDLEPAALHMATKPRRESHAPLATLHSHRLWTPGSNAAAFAHDWITESSVAPRSPSILSSSGSASPTAATDASSFKSTFTAATSVATGRTAGGQGYNRDSSQRALAGLLVLSSSAGKPAEPVIKTTRRRHDASPADWAAALDSAVRASGLTPRPRHHDHDEHGDDVATRHPAFFGSGALTCPASAAHPALAGALAGAIAAEAELRRQDSLGRRRRLTRGGSTDGTRLRGRRDIQATAGDGGGAGEDRLSQLVVVASSPAGAAPPPQPQPSSERAVAAAAAEEGKKPAVVLRRTRSRAAGTAATAPAGSKRAQILARIEALEQSTEEGMAEVVEAQQVVMSKGLWMPEEKNKEEDVVVAAVAENGAKAVDAPVVQQPASADTNKDNSNAAPAGGIIRTLVGMMWTPGGGAKPSEDAASSAAAAADDNDNAEERAAELRRRRSRKERRAEILAQIAAIEGSVTSAEGLTAAAKEQQQAAQQQQSTEEKGMWSRAEAAKTKRASRGGDKDWLDDSTNQRFSGVVLRY